MNSKWISIALGSSIAIVSVLASPVQAKSVQLVQLFPALEGIQLASEQQAQLEQLTRKTLPQIKNLLSPEQLKQFNASLSAEKSVRVAMQSLDLSASQKRKLSSELQTARSQVNRILNQEQQQQFTRNARAIQSK